MIRVMCKDTGEVANTYREYQKSRHWELLKNEALKNAEWETEIPRSIDDNSELQMHHLTYDTLGFENVATDIIIVTAQQHSFIHKYIEFIKIIKSSKGVRVKVNGKSKQIFNKPNPLGL